MYIVQYSVLQEMDDCVDIKVDSEEESGGEENTKRHGLMKAGNYDVMHEMSSWDQPHFSGVVSVTILIACFRMLRNVRRLIASLSSVLSVSVCALLRCRLTHMWRPVWVCLEAVRRIMKITLSCLRSRLRWLFVRSVACTGSGALCSTLTGTFANHQHDVEKLTPSCQANYAGLCHRALTHPPTTSTGC